MTFISSNKQSKKLDTSFWTFTKLYTNVEGVWWLLSVKTNNEKSLIPAKAGMHEYSVLFLCAERRETKRLASDSCRGVCFFLPVFSCGTWAWTIESFLGGLHLNMFTEWTTRVLAAPHILYLWTAQRVIVQELCESRGGRPELSVLTSLLVSMDVKNYWTMLRHWSQLVPNMTTDIWGH